MVGSIYCVFFVVVVFCLCFVWPLWKCPSESFIDRGKLRYSNFTPIKTSLFTTQTQTHTRLDSITMRHRPPWQLYPLLTYQTEVRCSEHMHCLLVVLFPQEIMSCGASIDWNQTKSNSDNVPLTGDNEIRDASGITRLFVSSSVKDRALAHTLPKTGSLRKKKRKKKVQYYHYY